MGFSKICTSVVNMCISVAHKKEKKKSWLLNWKEPKTAPVHVHTLMLVPRWLCVCVCV